LIFIFNHLESIKKRLLPIKFTETANFQFPLFNREFMIKVFSPGITFASLKFISKCSKDYENKTQITSMFRSFKPEKHNSINIKLSAQQSYYFAEILPLKFNKSERLTEDTLSYLYSITNSFSFFHRLFETNSEDHYSTFDLIKILEIFNPLNKPSNPKEKPKEIQVSIDFTLQTNLYGYAPVPPDIHGSYIALSRSPSFSIQL
jgi:hypothetical protein